MRKSMQAPPAGIPSDRHDPLLLLATTRVTKRLNPGQPGTRRMVKVHGNSLVCVRYRQDRLKLYRYTTVELVTAAAPIHPRRFDIATFGVHIERDERRLWAIARAVGGRWDKTDRLWWLRGALVRKLGWIERIVKT